MRVPCVLAAVLLGLTSSHCLLQNLSPTEKLRDAVHAYNDALRWGRMDLALEQTAPRYRRQFLVAHKDWQQSMVIADLEAVQMKLHSGRDHGSSTVRFHWYREDDMTLRRSTVRQRWKRSRDGFVIVSEQVVRGDRALLPAPKKKRKGKASAAAKAKRPAARDAGWVDVKPQAPSRAP
ncbi:MAG: hypothetical protein ACPGUV_01485 [Polyangiales bacterium]